MDLVHALGIFLFGAITARALQRNRHESVQARATLQGALKAGRDQPASLHPEIDLAACIGCGSCVKACPEKNVLGLIDGQAHLIDPASCVGHGACALVCPTKAIHLVLGTEERGVDIPELHPNYQTNVPGLFVAGELGGMGLIRNSVRQGVLAVQGMSPPAPHLPPGVFDLTIVGAGPAGIAAALEAKQRGMRFVLLEQETDLGGSILHYPRRKVVLSTAVRLPGHGRLRASRMTKEELLAALREAVDRAALPIHFGCRVERIDRGTDGLLEVRTSLGDFPARQVLLAIGRRGTPQKLEIPGEELNKVAYRLKDPEEYAGTRCLVVGGGDSALEAAVALAGEPGTLVTLSYRGKSIWRAKQENLRRLDEAVEQGRVQLFLNTSPVRIEHESVVLNVNGNTVHLLNDFVFIFAGGVLPKKFLEGTGVAMKTVHGEPLSAV
jgi:thioredoxin reductase/Pyruvate/2-oxoacid:ferredoxin oxidoreductase delta subunit